MRRIGPSILIAVAVWTASGCGTMANLNGRDYWGTMTLSSRPPFPFGGVTNNCAMLVHGAQLGVGNGAVIVSAMSITDMALSLGADVVTLPWTTYEYIRETRHPSGRYNLAMPSPDGTGRYDRFPILLRQDVANISDTTSVPDDLNVATFDKIAVGMPRTQVEEILNRKADSFAADGPESTWAIWYGNSASITVNFDREGKVMRKEFTAR